MMQRTVVALSALALAFLAACGGTPTPEPTAPPTQGPTDEPTSEIANSSGDQGFTLPTGVVIATVPVAAGTLAFVDTSGTPDAAPRPAISFDRIIFFQQGGIEASELFIELSGDGRVVRDGVESRLTSDQVALINATLDGLRFYDISGTFTSSGLSPDLYRYTITVESEQGGRTLTTDDGLTPDPLLALYDLLKTLTAPAAS